MSIGVRKKIKKYKKIKLNYTKRFLMNRILELAGVEVLEEAFHIDTLKQIVNGKI